MADPSGAGYLNVAKAALLPAILYYLALLVMIHFEAVKNDLGKLSPDMVPETKSVVSRLYYLVPIAVLILLLGMGRSVVFCANIATLSIVLLAMLKAETRFTFKSYIEALVASSHGALMVSACCACSGLIVGVLSLTGIGYKFINLITILAGDSLFLLMVYLMLTSFVLGMGIPTTPAYIVVATLGAPALIKAGAPQLVAHMFVFYYAILSFITPPVCVAAFAGLPSPVKAMETGFIALKPGIVAFIVPYMFVYQPAPLGIGRNARNHLGRHHSHHRRHRHRGRYAELASCSTSGMGTALLLTGGLTLIFNPGLSTDIIGFRASLRRHRPDAPPGEHHRRITLLRQEPCGWSTRHPARGKAVSVLQSFHKQLPRSFKMIIDLCGPRHGVSEHRRLRRRGPHRKAH